MENEQQLQHEQGYVGDVQVDLAGKTLYGTVQDINTLVSYKGKTVEELEEAFIEAVDDYLKVCMRFGLVPEAPVAVEQPQQVTFEAGLLEPVAKQGRISFLHTSMRNAVAVCAVDIESKFNIPNTALRICVQTADKWPAYGVRMSCDITPLMLKYAFEAVLEQLTDAQQ